VPDAIKNALEEAKSKLDKLLIERKKIEEQILDWKRVIDSLCAVSEDVGDTLPPDIEVVVKVQALLPGEAPSDDNPKRAESPPTRISFTNAIRTILRMRELKVVPVPEIRNELMECGFDFSKYKQKLVPVHNALKRLEEQGEVKAAKNEQGRVKGYQWIAPIERAFRDEHAWVHKGGLWDHMQPVAEETLRRLTKSDERVRQLLKEKKEEMEKAALNFGPPKAPKYTED
jgi:hypothetical protein